VAHTYKSSYTEIRRIIVCETIAQKKKKIITKKGNGVVQGIGPEFKPQY
jgi:hypothetical protein